MVYIVDLVFIAIIIAVVIASSKKGFAATLLDTFAVLLSGLATYKLTKPVADFFYDLCIRDLVMTNFKHAIDKMASGISFREKVSGLIDSLPETAVKFAKGIGVNVEALKGSIMQSAANSDEKLIELVTDKIAYNVMIVITQVITAVLLFIVITILIRLLAKLLTNILEKIPVVGTADTLLGGILGIVKAAAIVIVASTLLGIFVTSAEKDSPLKIVEESKIYNFITEHNPIVEQLNK